MKAQVDDPEFETKYPTVAKHSQHIDEIRTITEFVELLESKNIRPCVLDSEDWRNYPIGGKAVEKYILEMFGIDQDALSFERDKLYNEYVKGKTE